jgi:hypothetical protein
MGVSTLVASIPINQNNGLLHLALSSRYVLMYQGFTSILIITAYLQLSIILVIRSDMGTSCHVYVFYIHYYPVNTFENIIALNKQFD